MPPSPSASRRKRVLVVDDEYLIACDLAEAIGEAGFEVVGPVGRLKEAIRLIREGRTDAAIIDLNLGNGNEGVLLAEKLTAQFCPFIVVSGDDVACDRFRGRFPEAELVSKPVPRHELLRAITNLSERLAD